MLHSVRIRSMKDTSLRLGTPVFLVLMGLVVCLLWGIWENRKLADKYIAPQIFTYNLLLLTYNLSPCHADF